jgi:hypothetical protein
MTGPSQGRSRPHPCGDPGGEGDSASLALWGAFCRLQCALPPVIFRDTMHIADPAARADDDGPFHVSGLLV